MTWHDMEDVWGEAMARGGWRAGMRAHDRVLFCFALSMLIVGIPTMMGMHKVGAMAIPVGAEAGTDRILLMQMMFKATIYSGTPSLAEYLIEMAPQAIGREVKSLGLRMLICGGEPGAGILEVRKRLEAASDCRIFDVGAGFGFSCDHEEYQGMHLVADGLSYYELVDPETKEPVPLEDAAGEVLFSSLDADGFVWLHTSLGDIHQVFTAPCLCGRTGFRYKIVGRADDMLKVKGAIVYLTMVEGVTSSFCPLLTGEFRIILTEKPPRVVLPLKIRMERGEGVSKSELETLEAELKDALHAKLKITPEIVWAEPGELERSIYKGQVFEKLYEQTS